MKMSIDRRSDWCGVLAQPDEQRLSRDDRYSFRFRGASDLAGGDGEPVSVAFQVYEGRRDGGNGRGTRDALCYAHRLPSSADAAWWGMGDGAELRRCDRRFPRHTATVRGDAEADPRDPGRGAVRLGLAS